MADRPTRVLLVEDDPDTREMYATYLSYSGFDVAPAANAGGALETVRWTTPDVIVTDIAMPGMDGLELSRRLRASARTRDVPIIALSGQWAPRAREAGCNLVLSKPCLPDELLDAIETVLGGSERVRENDRFNAGGSGGYAAYAEGLDAAITRFEGDAAH